MERHLIGALIWAGAIVASNLAGSLGFDSYALATVLFPVAFALNVMLYVRKRRPPSMRPTPKTFES